MTGASPELAGIKRDLRKACEARRAAIPSERRIAAAKAVARIGLDFACATPPALVSAYCAMGEELDPSRLLERLASQGYVTALPVITPLGSPLIFRAWRPGEPLVPRKWGIREPTDQAQIVEPDVLLVPLLAFDRAGGRLGYGGGYYDRTLGRLRSLKQIVAIGLAFAEQELERVPVQTHDQPLDWVLTPDGPISTRLVQEH